MNWSGNGGGVDDVEDMLLLEKTFVRVTILRRILQQAGVFRTLKEDICLGDDGQISWYHADESASDLHQGD